MNSNKFSIKSRLASFRYAFNGLRSLLKNEHNSRIHLLAAVMAITMGFIMKIDLYEWSLLIIVIGLVFVAELFNSSVEALSDKIDSDYNDFIEKAKDYSAAGVMISAFISMAVGGLIFIPKLLKLL
jgi:diacylglycerol kinase (ATP)